MSAIPPASSPTNTPQPNRNFPKIRRHARGQAVVRLSGRDFYLGPYGSPESVKLYSEKLQEWLANGRTWGDRPAPRPSAHNSIDIAEIVEKFLAHVDQWYRHADGTPTKEPANIRQALRPLVNRYAATAAADFGPLALEDVQRSMIADEGWCLSYINKQIARIKAMFKWAKNKQLVGPLVYEGIRDLPGLKPGRSEARVAPPVKPVPQPYIDAIIPHVSRQVAAMIKLQLLTGARPGEVCMMRAADLRMAGRVWMYEPPQHKTAHHGKRRRIPIGPRAQEVLRPFLVGNPAEPFFKPCDAERERNAARQLPDRKLSPSAQRRRERQRPEGRAGVAYTADSYRRAIARGCDAAFPPPEDLAWRENESLRSWRGRLSDKQRKELAAWQKSHRWNPHRVRHSSATNLRAQFGIEAAQHVLGHSDPRTTEIYAERDWATIEKIMGEVG